MNIFIVVVGVLVLWSVWGYFSSNVEQTEYSVVTKMDGYEIRQYSAHIVAQTKVQGSYNEALNKGFTIIAGYIFGDNAKKETIAMTAPVVSGKQSSEKIAMTAPVLATTGDSESTISFAMPKKYTLDSLPVPTDTRIELVEVPAQKVAALRFSWFRSTDRVRNMEKRLLELLAKDGVEVVGSPSYAGYNAPWTPPWMMRNEILVEVK